MAAGKRAKLEYGYCWMAFGEEKDSVCIVLFAEGGYARMRRRRLYAHFGIVLAIRCIGLLFFFRVYYGSIDL